MSTKTEDALSAISTVVESALAVDQSEDQIEAQAGGYEALYQAFVADYLVARDEGAQQQDVVEAIVAEAKARGVKPHAGSKQSMMMVDALATFHALDGDLPTLAGVTWVYRPNARSALGIYEGEASLYSTIKNAIDPGDAREALKAKGIKYGKPIVDAALKAATNKTEAIANLQELLRSYKKAVQAVKAEAKGPVKAEKYLRAAAGPLSKVVACIDADEFDDTEKVREIANEILAEVNAILGHAKVKVS